MPQQTDWNVITIPTPDDISDEDDGVWGRILNDRTFEADFDDADDNAGFDELAVKRVTGSPPDPSNMPSGSAGRICIVTDDTPPTVWYFRGSEWDRVNRTETSDTHYMSDFADPDTGSPVDNEFDNAIEAAEAGDTIDFNGGAYELDSPHTITKTLEITSSSGEVICTNTSTNDPHIKFEGGGRQNNTTTTSAIAPGDRTLDVNDPSIFAEDDRVLIMDDQYSSQVETTIQFSAVESVDGTNSQISLTGSSVRDFASGAYVYHVNLLKSPSFRGLDTRGGGIRHLQMEWCEDGSFNEVRVTEYTEISLYSLNCWKPTYRSVEATDPNSLGSGDGEPLAIYRCSDGYVESARIYDCRRGIDIAWGTHTLTIIDPVIHAADIAGISVHQDGRCDQLSIFDGSITTVPDATTGYGVSDSQFCSTVIVGTSFVCDRAGIYNTGSLRATNCSFKPSASNAQYAILASGPRGRYSGMEIVDPDGNFNEPVRIDTRAGLNIEDIYVDANITYSGQNAMYAQTSNSGGQTIEGVTFRGTIRGGTSDQPIFIWPDNAAIDHVDISVDVHNTSGQAIRLNGAGGLGIVKIHNCHLDSGQAAVYDHEALTGAQIVITDCTLETGTTSLSFDDEVQDLIITNNIIPGSVTTSGATGTVVNTDNV